MKNGKWSICICKSIHQWVHKSVFMHWESGPCPVHDTRKLKTWWQTGNKRRCSLKILQNLLTAIFHLVHLCRRSNNSHSDFSFQQAPSDATELHYPWKKAWHSNPQCLLCRTHLFFNSAVFYTPVMMPHFCHHLKYPIFNNYTSALLVSLCLYAGTFFLNVRWFCTAAILS